MLYNKTLSSTPSWVPISLVERLVPARHRALLPPAWCCVLAAQRRRWPPSCRAKARALAASSPRLCHCAVVRGCQDRPIMVGFYPIPVSAEFLHSKKCSISMVLIGDIYLQPRRIDCGVPCAVAERLRGSRRARAFALDRRAASLGRGRSARRQQTPAERASCRS